MKNNIINLFVIAFLPLFVFWNASEAPLPAPSDAGMGRDSFPALSGLSDENILALTQYHTAQCEKIKELLTRRAVDAINSRQEMEEALKLAQSDTLFGPAALQALKEKVAEAKKIEKEAGKTGKKAIEQYRAALKLNDQPAANLKKKLPGAWQKTETFALNNGIELDPLPFLTPPPAEIAVVPTDTAATNTATEKSSPKKSKKKKKDAAIAEATTIPVVDTLSVAVSAAAAPDTVQLPVTTAAKEEKTDKKPKKKDTAATKKYKKYDPDSDVMLHPPTPPCSTAVSRKDDFSGEQFIELQKSELFRYTAEALKKKYTDQAHIICEASLANVGFISTLNLTITVRDAQARRTFGNLPKGGIAVIKYLDGEIITLYNLRSDEGQADVGSQTTTYRGQYAIDRNALKKMQKTELDKIRIGWSTGYEDYPIQQIDLLQRQAACLFN